MIDNLFMAFASDELALLLFMISLVICLTILGVTKLIVDTRK